MLLNAIIEKDEDGYFAYVPGMQGCVSQGATYEEAAALYVESLGGSKIESFRAKRTVIAPIEVMIGERQTA